MKCPAVTHRLGHAVIASPVYFAGYCIEIVLFSVLLILLLQPSQYPPGIKPGNCKSTINGGYMEFFCLGTNIQHHPTIESMTPDTGHPCFFFHLLLKNHVFFSKVDPDSGSSKSIYIRLAHGISPENPSFPHLVFHLIHTAVAWGRAWP